MEDILEKKRKFDNYEISVLDLSEEEVKAINKMYKEEIARLKKLCINKIMNERKKF